MTDEKEHKETLSGQVPEGLPEKFKKTVPPGFKIGHCLAAAAELWIDMPNSVRALLLICGRESPMFSGLRGEIIKRLTPLEEVLGLPPESPDITKSLLANLRKIAQDVQGNRLRLLSPEEQKEVDDLRRLLGPQEKPEPARQRREKKA